MRQDQNPDIEAIRDVLDHPDVVQGLSPRFRGTSQRQSGAFQPGTDGRSQVEDQLRFARKGSPGPFSPERGRAEHATCRRLVSQRKSGAFQPGTGQYAIRADGHSDLAKAVRGLSARNNPTAVDFSQKGGLAKAVRGLSARNTSSIPTTCARRRLAKAVRGLSPRNHRSSCSVAGTILLAKAVRGLSARNSLGLIGARVVPASSQRQSGAFQPGTSCTPSYPLQQVNSQRQSGPFNSEPEVKGSVSGRWLSKRQSGPFNSERRYDRRARLFEGNSQRPSGAFQPGTDRLRARSSEMASSQRQSGAFQPGTAGNRRCHAPRNARKGSPGPFSPELGTDQGVQLVQDNSQRQSGAFHPGTGLSPRFRGTSQRQSGAFHPGTGLSPRFRGTSQRQSGAFQPGTASQGIRQRTLAARKAVRGLSTRNDAQQKRRTRNQSAGLAKAVRGLSSRNNCEHLANLATRMARKGSPGPFSPEHVSEDCFPCTSSVECRR